MTGSRALSGRWLLRPSLPVMPLSSHSVSHLERLFQPLADENGAPEKGLRADNRLRDSRVDFDLPPSASPAIANNAAAI
jgi:hypothetical protein